MKDLWGDSALIHGKTAKGLPRATLKPGVEEARAEAMRTRRALTPLGRRLQARGRSAR